MSLSASEMNDRDVVSVHVSRIGSGWGLSSAIVSMAIADAHAALRDGADLSEALRLGIQACAQIKFGARRRVERPRFALVPRGTALASDPEPPYPDGWRGRVLRAIDHPAASHFALIPALCALVYALSLGLRS